MSCAGKAIERTATSAATSPRSAHCASVHQYCIDAHHVLGSGSYSVVHRAVDVESGAEVACKQLTAQSRGSITCLSREVTALRALAPHPNVVQLRAFHRDHERAYLFLSSPRGATTLRNYLDEHVTPLDEHVVREIMRQLVSAVQHCHQSGVAHRDLKLENVLIVPHSLHVTLIDFGLALTEHVTRVNEALGSPLYMAPEVLQLQWHCAIKADMWALGVVLHQLLFRQFPFMADTLDELHLLVSTRRYTVPSDHVPAPSPATAALLHALLAPDPVARPSCAQTLLLLTAPCTATPR